VYNIASKVIRQKKCQPGLIRQERGDQMEKEKEEIMALLRRRDVGIGREQLFSLLPWLSEAGINAALNSLLGEGAITATRESYFELSATLKKMDGGLGSYFSHHVAY